MKAGLLIGLMSILFSQSSFAEMKQIPEHQKAGYTQALKNELRSFVNKFTCSGDDDGIIPSKEGMSIPLLVDYAQKIYIDDSGDQPAIVITVDFDRHFMSLTSVKATAYRVSFSTSSDYKSIERITLESQVRVKVNKGNLISPDMVDAMETLSTIECEKK